MNRYGLMARSHWEKWLPARYAVVADPDSFFSEMGREAERQIEELAETIAGTGPTGESYLERAGRLTAARSQAEEIILPQLVLPEPEAAGGDSGEDSQPPAVQARPAVISPDHTEWAEVNAEQQERLGRDL